ncbi:MAG: DJ-1/PfpI family protein, partial [Pararheinheimera sp.]|nr:DJ-1/PfpI family protein [Rheinheimera sp.]
LVEEGVHYASLVSLYGELAMAGAVVHFVGPRIGLFASSSGENIEANKSMENSPAVLFDALVLPDGNQAVMALAGHTHTADFIKNTYQHCKTILALGDGRELLEMAGVGPGMAEDEGILLADSANTAGVVTAFIDAIAAHRHPSRDPAIQ